MSLESSRLPSHTGSESLTSYELTLLGLSKAYRYTCNTLSSAWGWYGQSRLKAVISRPHSLFVLGKHYPAPSALGDASQEDGARCNTESIDQLDRHVSRFLWFSYRTGFQPIGLDGLTGDVGWGCTLRSCQMLLAQALLMQVSRHTDSNNEAGIQKARKQVVGFFHDEPLSACLSIHAICREGKKYGLVPGRWMGPYALCRAVTDISHAKLRELVRIVLIETGGGAPCLDPAILHSQFDNLDSHSHETRGRESTSPMPGLLVLVPVVLGVDHLNSVYAEQLKEILQWKQSTGIIGGRPGHSYYFMGFQGDHMLCLDPHTIQSTVAEPEDTSTHEPVVILTVPMTAIDSTMALGFHCQSRTDLDNLLSQVQELADTHSRNPLLCVGSLPELHHDLDCSWDSGDETASWEGCVKQQSIEAKFGELNLATAADVTGCSVSSVQGNHLEVQSTSEWELVSKNSAPHEEDNDTTV